MKPLETSQQVMMMLCMCPADESTSKTKRMFYAGFTFIVLIVAFIGLLTSVGFFVKYASTDLENSLYAIFQVGAYAAMLNSIIVGLINRDRIATIFTELSNLYTADAGETSFQFITEANDKSEWLWRIYNILGLELYLVNVFVSAIVSIIYCFYKYGVVDADHLYKPYKQLFPWNQHTLYGYLADYTLCIIAGENYMLINGAVLILFISMCWHHQAFYRRFCNTAFTLDQPENKRNTHKIFCELIRFHVSVKHWFMESAEVYSPLILTQLICYVILTAAVVFELDLRKEHIDPQFFMLLFALPIGILDLYFYCYFGRLATESYEEMAECMYERNWHEWSPDLQKEVLFMIQNMQTPIYYHGFGVANLSLETFIKVFRSIFSYYMAFKTLTK